MKTTKVKVYQDSVLVAEKTFNKESELLKCCKALKNNHVEQKRQTAKELGIEQKIKVTGRLLWRYGRSVKETMFNPDFREVGSKLTVEFETI